MNSKERVLTSLNHKEPDRVPIDFGATRETTIHTIGYQRLKEKLGLCLDKPNIDMLKTAGFARVDEEIQRFVGADVRGVFPYPANRNSIKYEQKEGYTYFTDEFGLAWRKPLKDGLYFDIIGHPLANKSDDEIRNHPFPNPRSSKRFEHISEYLNTLNPEDYPLVFDNCFGNGIFQMSNHLMGYDNFLMAMMMEEEKTTWLLDKITDMKIQFWDEVLERFGDRIDVVKELDDMGTQANLWIAPEMYQDLIKPRLEKLIRFIKNKKPGVKMMMHSCGSVFPIIPDLIDAGVDILNPVQYTAQGMNPHEIKKQFGKDIVIWGGGVDTQKTLPQGTVQEVKDETKRMLDIFMPGGGFVFAPVHAIQADVPTENILAMWETVKEFGQY
jgi:uroporphyrinogen decarboxylase